MTTQLTPLLMLLEADHANSEEVAQASRAVDLATPQELQQLIHALRQLVISHPDHAWKEKLAPVLNSLQRWGHHNHEHVQPSDEALVAEIAGFYRDLAATESPRHHLLTLLATLRIRSALATMVDEFVADPPQSADVACLPLVPLFRRRDREVLTVFPRLLEALQHPHAATGILDLANYLTREEIADRHPAQSRFEQLVVLLEGVVSQLERLETHPATTSTEYRMAHQQVQQATPLIVSICDALGLIGDERAIPHLQHVMDLRHRRLQLEAAAALTRFGDEDGIQRLAELAAEASVRLRVLQYAGELDIEDRIDQQYQDPLAVAEAELVTCLSEPGQFGFPPSSCALIDARTLYWPGYEEPRMCYLFRFSYEVERSEQRQSFSNVGIAGPLTHVLHADLTQLPPEAVYAAFAGWQAEHSSIYEIAVADWNLKQEHVAEDFLQRIGQAGYEDIRPLMLGYVLERMVLVAQAKRPRPKDTRLGPEDTASEAGTVIINDKEIHWYGIGNPERPIGPAEAYCMDKGQQLLDSFN